MLNDVMYSPVEEQSWNARSERLKNARGRETSRKPNLGGRTKSKKQVTVPQSDLRMNGQSGYNSPGVRDRYEVIPPLRTKSKHVDPEDDERSDDSWGDEDSDVEINVGASFVQRRMLQQPPMSFAMVPMVHPGFLKEPGNQKPKKKKHRANTKASTNAPKKNKSREIGVGTDSPAEQSSPYPQPYRTNNPYHSLPGASHMQSRYPQGMYMPYPTYSYPNQEQYQIDPRFQYISVSPAPNRGRHTIEPKTRFPDNRTKDYRPDKQAKVDEAALQFYDDVRFAKSYTDDFIESALKEDSVPDLLIEVLDEMFPDESIGAFSPLPRRQQGYPHHPGWPPRQSLTSSREAEKAIWMQNSLAKEILLDLINEHIRSEVKIIVKETSDEYVQAFVAEGVLYDIYKRLLAELIRELCHDEFGEIMLESREEMIVDGVCVEPVIDEMIQELVLETLHEQDSKQKHKQLEQISEHASTKFLDSLALEFMLSQIARQEQIWDEDEQMQKMMDSMAVDILLRMHVNIDLSKQNTLQNRPMRRYHEKYVTNVLVDTLLNELCLSLDQDMLDVDEQELGQITQH